MSPPVNINAQYPTSAAVAAHLVAAFREGLRDLAYVEGQKVAIEYRWADGDVDRLPLLARELVTTSIDVPRPL